MFLKSIRHYLNKTQQPHKIGNIAITKVRFLNDICPQCNASMKEDTTHTHTYTHIHVYPYALKIQKIIKKLIMVIIF